jgi:hypothetical protein
VTTTFIGGPWDGLQQNISPLTYEWGIPVPEEIRSDVALVYVYKRESKDSDRLIYAGVA